MTFEDGTTLELGEVGLVPGIGLVTVDAEGIETIYPWHRISKLERQVPIVSPLLAPSVIPTIGGPT